jgi:hypothetical protein
MRDGNLPDLTITGFNDAFASLFGYERTKL